MKDYIVKDPWQIIEDQYRAEYNEISESIFSIGNGRMGQRANFEEDYTGKSLQGSYIAGIYYPDKTRVGWWKNGYPEYFAKVINSTNWIGLHLVINGHTLDLAKIEVLNFERRLDMKTGVLYRNFKAKLPDDTVVEVSAKRLFSIVETAAAGLSYCLTVMQGRAAIELESYLDGDIENRDSNYDEKFWEEVSRSANDTLGLQLKTKKTAFHVHTEALNNLFVGDAGIPSTALENREKYVAQKFQFSLEEGQHFELNKYVAITTSENHKTEDLQHVAKQVLERVSHQGITGMLQNQADAWAKVWNDADIQIDGDVSAQQAIRFNIFQLFQTYTGEDERLNIGPKGFTGEKYGGVTYWDTEAYCLPFYMATTDSKVARNLLLYRYHHLPKAIENAEKLGFRNGAALYPMVTINGEECHNEWEITFEEIHRNGAIAFAIYNYVRYTGDTDYLAAYGLEVLIAISRFWAQRVNWSADKNKYVMLGVTGPNEYENNVNNNWYTNRIASWCMEYTGKVIKDLEQNAPERLREILEKVSLENKEQVTWNHIVEQFYYPEDASKGVFLQQDGFLDKELIPVSELSDAERPLNQKWSWDRILRSCYIKQADVLQGLYFLEDQYDLETIERNYNFYEPLTVHESSLSPCVHAIIAAKLGKEDKAYEFYLRTSRLDLDDYNNDTEDGLHITSMAGTWMTIVEGFAGMRVLDGKLHFQPILPKEWSGYNFKINFRGAHLHVSIQQDKTIIANETGPAAVVVIDNEEQEINEGQEFRFSNPRLALN